MSTTVTALEPYDTYMLDYPTDTDVAMYSGTIPAESWLSPEDGHMEDDSAHSQSEPIEVEMANDEEYVEEYDMADTDILYYPAEDTELVDVEVVDEHSVASPSALPIDSAPSHSEHVTGFLEPPSMLPSAMPSPSMHQVDLSARPFEHDWSLTNPVHSETSVEPASVPAEPLVAVSSDAGEATFVSAPVIPVVEGVEASEVAPTPPVPSPTQEVAVEELPLEGRADADGYSLSNVEVEEHTVSNTEPAPEATEETNAVTTPLHDENEPPVVDAAAHPEEHILHEESEGQERYEVYETFEESQLTVTSGTDPHEISEGIFIDPPPAVLLEVSYTSERFEYSLFNQPTSGSGSQTPTADVPPQSSQTYSLLLQERPTLYYEPLSEVFAALRQEENVISVPELAEGELVLDAYDLQLVASEDNMHMHEVTLHELNVLHDGADLSGPLRLRLYARSPRFITRYHALRDQISRLELGVEDEVHDTYDEQPAVHEEKSLPEQVNVNAEELELAPSEFDVNSDVHTALPEPEPEPEPQENPQTAIVTGEHHEEFKEHDAHTQEEGEYVEPSSTDQHAEDITTVAGDIDDAYADDTTEGTEADEISHVANVGEDVNGETIPEEAQPIENDNVAPTIDQAHDEDALTHEELIESGEADLLPLKIDAPHETSEYNVNDATDQAGANTDQAAHDAIRDIREAREDELEPQFDEQAQFDTEHPEENIYEDDYEDYDDEFDELTSVDEQHKLTSLSVQTSGTPAKPDEGEIPSSTSTQYDTPASRVPKRSFDYVEPDDYEDYEDGDFDLPSSPPDTKRQRTG